MRVTTMRSRPSKAFTSQFPEYRILVADAVSHVSIFVIQVARDLYLTPSTRLSPELSTNNDVNGGSVVAHSPARCKPVLNMKNMSAAVLSE